MYFGSSATGALAPSGTWITPLGDSGWLWSGGGITHADQHRSGDSAGAPSEAHFASTASWWTLPVSSWAWDWHFGAPQGSGYTKLQVSRGVANSNASGAGWFPGLSFRDWGWPGDGHRAAAVAEAHAATSNSDAKSYLQLTADSSEQHSSEASSKHASLHFYQQFFDFTPSGFDLHPAEYIHPATLTLLFLAAALRGMFNTINVALSCAILDLTIGIGTGGTATSDSQRESQGQGTQDAEEEVDNVYTFNLIHIITLVCAISANLWAGAMLELNFTAFRELYFVLVVLYVFLAWVLFVPARFGGGTRVLGWFWFGLCGGGASNSASSCGAFGNWLRSGAEVFPETLPALGPDAGPVAALPSPEKSAVDSPADGVTERRALGTGNSNTDDADLGRTGAADPGARGSGASGSSNSSSASSCASSLGSYYDRDSGDNLDSVGGGGAGTLVGRAAAGGNTGNIGGGLAGGNAATATTTRTQKSAGRELADIADQGQTAHVKSKLCSSLNQVTSSGRRKMSLADLGTLFAAVAGSLTIGKSAGTSATKGAKTKTEDADGDAGGLLALLRRTGAVYIDLFFHTSTFIKLWAIETCFYAMARGLHEIMSSYSIAIWGWHQGELEAMHSGATACHLLGLCMTPVVLSWTDEQQVKQAKQGAESPKNRHHMNASSPCPSADDVEKQRLIRSSSDSSAVDATKRSTASPLQRMERRAFLIIGACLVALLLEGIFTVTAPYSGRLYVICSLVKHLLAWSSCLRESFIARLLPASKRASCLSLFSLSWEVSTAFACWLYSNVLFDPGLGEAATNQEAAGGKAAGDEGGSTGADDKRWQAGLPFRFAFVMLLTADAMYMYLFWRYRRGEIGAI